MKNLVKKQKKDGITYFVFTIISLFVVASSVLYFYVSGWDDNTWKHTYFPFSILVFGVCSLIVFIYKSLHSYPFVPLTIFDSSWLPAIALELNGKALFLIKVERKDESMFRKTFDITFNYEGIPYKLTGVSEERKQLIETSYNTKRYFTLNGKSKIPGKQFNVEIDVSIT